MTDNKIIDKIRKILELSKNNPSKEEAEAAALKAQKLLAEYHISVSDLDMNDPDEISGASTDVGGTKKWRWMLAEVVANNFRCKFYSSGSLVTFYGHETDIKVAKDIFEYLFTVAHKGACKERDAIHRIYGTSKGVYNGYCIGFVEGVKTALGKQCTALALVTPKDVEDSYTEFSKHFSVHRNSVTLRGHRASIEGAKEKGFSAGKDSIGARRIG